MTDLDMTSYPTSALAADVLVLAAAPAKDSAKDSVKGSAGTGDKDSAGTAGTAGAPQPPQLLTEGVDLSGLDAAALTQLLPSLGFKAKADEVVRLPASAVADAPGSLSATTVMVVGLGPAWRWAKDPARDAAALGASQDQLLRRAAGRATRELAGCAEAALLLPASSPERLSAVLEGALVGTYSWSGGSKAAPAPVGTVVVSTCLAGTEQAHAALARARVLAESVCLTRDLVNEPPNRLDPVTFTAHALEVAQAFGLSAQVRDEAQLAAEGFGGILGVGQGSATPPRLVRLGWEPRTSGGTAPHVALIGKGITFDSGGLSLKPAASMPEMKSDMAGAATVLAVVAAAARLELPVRVTAWLALAENMPGSGAQRPSDIVTMVNGTTVEITNTDAEGRLVMADALAQAVTEAPDLVLDVATLTGAQLVALGDQVTGVMGTPGLRDHVVGCARSAGEAAWAMPLPEHLRANLDSPYADLRNSATSRWGGMLVAGLFLREFVGQVPWAHLDIAGPSFNDGTARGLETTGGTGAGVATLLRLLEDPAPLS